MSGDYEVGYRKPPKHSRFAKGESGNPRGRARGSLNLKTVLARELAARITVREGGAELRVSKLEGVAKSLVNQALKGNVRAVVQLAVLLGLDEATATTVEAPLTAEERAVLEAALARFSAGTAAAKSEEDAAPPGPPTETKEDDSR
jgi:hypothetical protein